jgi:hypothetical protein
MAQSKEYRETWRDRQDPGRPERRAARAAKRADISEHRAAMAAIDAAGCVVCGGPFVGIRVAFRRYCSPLCRERDRNARGRRGFSDTPTRRAMIAASPVCAVCGGTVRLRVDHDHVGGQFRGILCDGCNNAAGRVGDQAADAWKLRALADYLGRTAS